MKLNNFLFLVTITLGSHVALAQSDSKVNIRVNPLGLLFGLLNADADFKLSEKFTLGPRLGYFGVSAGTTSASAILAGARGNLYLGGTTFTDSWYFGPSITYSRISLTSGSAKGSSSSVGVQAIFGYQWVWGSGFNICLGGGTQYTKIPSTVTSGDGEVISRGSIASGILPALEFTLGVAF